MILAAWVSITLGVFGIAALLLAYYLVTKRLPKSKDIRGRELWDVPRRLWFTMDEALRAVADGMYKRPWLKVYGQEVIQFFRELDAHVPGWERAEVPMLGQQLADFATSLSDKERNELRETADSVIDGCRSVEDYELTRLTAYVGFLRSLSESEEENTEKDAERFRKLCAMYDNMQKQKTKLNIKCPGCGRSVKGITQAMIGDTGACPKCRTEFVIEVPDQKAKI